MREKEEIIHNYICAKCRGTKADMREVVISKSGLLPFVSGKDSRYIEVTCVLCGYTEFYNRAIYIASHASKTADEESLALPKRVDRG